jgi:predicted DCC family thiol-disulfide oxidoreductase YuxK
MPGEPFLVYDGDCGFCTSSVRWLRRWVQGAYRVEAWQDADLAELGLDEEQCRKAVQWVDPGGGRAQGAAAFAAALRTDRRWRAFGRLLEVSPLSRLAEAVYEVVARNRHRLPGGTPACRLPAPERPR